MLTLDPLLCPKSVAVVGANDDPTSFGGRFWRYAALSVEIERMAVNMREDALSTETDTETATRTVATSLRELSHVPDLVVLATPPQSVATLIEEGVELGVRAAIVVTKVPEEARERVRDLCASRMALLGGSSLGLFDANRGVVLSSSVSLDLPIRKGALAVVSQSGALMGILHARAIHQGIGVGNCVSTGEQLQIRVEHLLARLAHDEHIRTVGVYIEDIDPQAFADAALLLQMAGKRLIALKGGTTAGGAAVTAAHSGALASNGRAFQALADELGVVVTEDPDALLNCMQATQIEGSRFFVGTLSGGIAALAADLSASHGVALVDRSAIAASVPVNPGNPAANGNPVDIDADALDDGEAIDLISSLAADPRGDGLLLVVSDRPQLDTLLARLAVLDAATLGRIHLCSECSGQYEPLMVPHAPTMRGFVRGVSAFFQAIAMTRRRFGTTHRYSHYRGARYEPELDRRAGAPVLLDAMPTWEVLAVAGLPMLPLRQVSLVEDLEPIMAEYGAPIVLKRDGVAHRSYEEVSIVRQCAEACATFDLLSRTGKVLAQPLATPGLEFFVGVTRDPVFGSLFLIGAGGRELEEMNDVAIHVGLPGRDKIFELLRKTSTVAWLINSVGHELVDLDALADVAGRLCEWIDNTPIPLASVDLNPVVVGRHGATVLDAKIRLAEEELSGVGA